MKFRNLSLGLKIGIIMAFIPLIAGVFDFFVFCKGGENFGEGCGFLLIIISFPFLWLIQLILFIILYPLQFVTDSFYVWYMSYIISASAIYFFMGLLIGKITIRLFGHRIIKLGNNFFNDKINSI